MDQICYLGFPFKIIQGWGEGEGEAYSWNVIEYELIVIEA